MNVMQYKVLLPMDYDMEIIRQRVKTNGFKTDGFQDLLLKSYLMIDSETRKEYSPLYLWNNEAGMNKFIFEGFYDNILTSFGWQTITSAIPLQVELGDSIKESAYVLEIEHDILPTTKMVLPEFSLEKSTETGRVLIYNPAKWKYVEFYFFIEKPTQRKTSDTVYEILHLSM
ncbi:DUF4865 family protein [Enterococcus sp. MJM16]|uniref:DUF4865 family protein n=2 Tax=Candidatus Enterococcus murrayae TaxID=2815321 RepID=A0ABS3HJX3_9ENTE|nr:DUF4865 family protein [Enterococcus sp. MJM16]